MSIESKALERQNSDEIFSNIDDLHMRDAPKTTEEKCRQCPNCKKIFSTMTNLIRHRSTHARCIFREDASGPSDIVASQCRHCKRTFANEVGLKIHLAHMKSRRDTKHPVRGESDGVTEVVGESHCEATDSSETNESNSTSGAPLEPDSTLASSGTSRDPGVKYEINSNGEQVNTLDATGTVEFDETPVIKNESAHESARTRLESALQSADEPKTNTVVRLRGVIQESSNEPEHNNVKRENSTQHEHSNGYRQRDDFLATCVGDSMRMGNNRSRSSSSANAPSAELQDPRTSSSQEKVSPQSKEAEISSVLDGEASQSESTCGRSNACERDSLTRCIEESMRLLTDHSSSSHSDSASSVDDKGLRTCSSRTGVPSELKPQVCGDRSSASKRLGCDHGLQDEAKSLHGDAAMSSGVNPKSTGCSDAMNQSRLPKKRRSSESDLDEQTLSKRPRGTSVDNVRSQKLVSASKYGEGESIESEEPGSTQATGARHSKKRRRSAGDIRSCSPPRGSKTANCDDAFSLEHESSFESGDDHSSDESWRSSDTGRFVFCFDTLF